MGSLVQPSQLRQAHEVRHGLHPRCHVVRAAEEPAAQTPPPPQLLGPPAGSATDCALVSQTLGSRALALEPSSTLEDGVEAH
jgi:hypothetical protein